MPLLSILYFILGLFLQSSDVMICKSNTAYAFHARKCQGLNECTHTIEKIPLEQAQNMGRKACKYCYDVSSDGKPGQASQCKALTKKGKQCSRKAGTNGYCWQHI